VIPPECYERSNRRAWLLVARSVALWLAVISALALTDRWYLLAPLWVLAGLSVSGLFVLGHDCAHGALFESKQLNRSVGRALMAPSLHIYEAWVIGHNRIHHGHTLRQGMDFVWHPLTVDEYRALSRIARLRHRLEWSVLGSGVYYARSVWWQKMMRFTPPERYRDAVRRDRRFLAIVGGAALAITTAVSLATGHGALGSSWMIVKLFLIPFTLFCTTIGFTVYVHHIAPDIKWWPRRAWNSFHGQVEGTTVLRLPKVIDVLFFHNIFVHVPHHVDVRIPCYELPRAADAIIEAFPEVDHRRYRFADFRTSTRECKLYDFDAQRWLRYSAASGVKEQR
jgi:omega-6 fatty acid desaturase (delta-12 desaturase)